MTARYLVTGGLGFLGSALTRALLLEGASVRVLDDGSRGGKDRLGDLREHAEIIQGDIRDLNAVVRAARDIDSICHLAFINGTRTFYERPADVLEVGVKGISNVIDACRRQHVQELVVASSSEVYQTPPHIPTDESVPLSIPDPLNPRYSYAGGKVISELMALNFGREEIDRVLIFRPHNVYGPNMGWEHVVPQLIKRIYEATKRGSEPTVLRLQGDGSQSRAFVYVDDFVRGLLRVIRAGEHRQIYNIGTEEEVTIRELADRIGSILGVRLLLEAGPQPEGEALRRCPDITKLRGLGFAPEVGLDQGLAVTADWYLKRLEGVGG